MNPGISLMMGTKSSSTSCATFCESLTPSYRRTATYIALHYLLKRGRDPSAPPSDQRVQCARLQGLAQLPRTPLLGTWVDKGKMKGRGRSRPRPSHLALETLSVCLAYLALCATISPSVTWGGCGNAEDRPCS